MVLMNRLRMCRRRKPWSDLSVRIQYRRTVILSWETTATTPKIPATGPILLLQKMRFSERRSSATGRFLNLKFLNKIFPKEVCENENHISHTSFFILIIPFSDITRSIRSSCSSVGILSHIRLSLHRIAFSQSSGIFSR